MKHLLLITLCMYCLLVKAQKNSLHFATGGIVGSSLSRNLKNVRGFSFNLQYGISKLANLNLQYENVTTNVKEFTNIKYNPIFYKVGIVQYFGAAHTLFTTLNLGVQHIAETLPLVDVGLGYQIKIDSKNSIDVNTGLMFTTRNSVNANWLLFNLKYKLKLK